MQVPAPSQASTPLQASPSLHELPRGLGVVRQPDAGSQLAVTQALPPSVQVSGLPAQLPSA
jgi:hypothetical protein